MSGVDFDGLGLPPEDSAFAGSLAARLKREEPEWGHLPAALRFKQALVARLGVDRAFGVCRRALAVPGIDRLVSRSVHAARDVARTEALSFAELWSGGAPIVHPPFKVIGESNHADFSFIGRSGYLACLPDILLRGRSAVVSRSAMAVVDYENNERTCFPDNPEYDPGILHAEPNRYWMMEPSIEPEALPEAFMLSGSHTVDFGHWMIEYLPKLALALMAGLPRVPVLVDQLIPRTMHEALACLLPEGMPTVVIPHLAPIAVRKLWYAANPLYKGFYPFRWDFATFAGMGTDAAHFASLMAELKRRMPAAIHAPGGFERVFLARKPGLAKKKLANHQEIEAAAAERGFRVLYPEEFSFVEQVQIANTARYIVAPEGSNSYLAFFASPGCRMCTLSPPYTFPLADINAIVAAVGVDLRVLTGPYMSFDADFPFWSDYRIDVETLRHCIDAMLRGD